MSLRKTMPMEPGSRPDPKQERTYQASRGGHVRDDRPKPAEQKGK